jgi:HPt (histidine-containing phosphotransfer) domain-containing protein/CheY-like chemotaxis protein
MSSTHEAAPTRRRLNVLLINQAPENRSQAEQRLLTAGHSVYRVSRPQEAARVLHHQSVSLVLIDPMDDQAAFHEFLAAMRASGGRLSARNTPVYALAGDDVCKSVSRFVDRLLPIPLNVDTLTAAYLAFLTESVAMRRRSDDVEPCCEIDAAIDRLGGDVELYKDLVDRFLDDSAGTRRQIKAAIDTLDGAKLHGASHSLKGLAASCGATAAAEALANLESLGRQRDFSAVIQSWNRFQAEMERTAEALAPYYRRLSNGAAGNSAARSG